MFHMEQIDLDGFDHIDITLTEEEVSEIERMLNESQNS